MDVFAGRGLVVAIATLTATAPWSVRAQSCYDLDDGQVCFTGVFPNDPIVVELGGAIQLPDTSYTNDTGGAVTFTIEWAGVDIAGSAQIHTTLVPAHSSSSTFTGLTFPVPPAITDVGTHTINIGWTAQGTNFVTLQRQFELVVVAPGKVREVIQVPVRWCVVEGSPQAGSAKPGQTVPGTALLSLLRQVNDEIWLPQAGILFRHASAPLGIPVVKDPYVGENLGDLALSNNDEWHTAGALCEKEWNNRYPDERGIVLVNGRRIIPDTAITVGGVAPAVPWELRVKSGDDPRTGQRGDDLCGHPRHLRVDDVTWLSMAVVYDQALFGETRFNYTGDQFKPTRVLAHEIGHALTLGHGNGLDDNHDGLLPPSTGPRRFDGYCDPLGNHDGLPVEDQGTPFTTCEVSFSLMRGGNNTCVNLQPLQREMAREAAKLVPGAIRTDPSLDPAGQLVADGGACPPDCTIPRSLVLRKLEMAVTPDSAVTTFSHGILQLLPSAAPSRYLVFADLDDDSSTGCSASEPGLPVFQGAELKTEVAVTASGDVLNATPHVWRCESGAWVEKSDPGIGAAAYVLPVGAHDEPGLTGGGVVAIHMPDAIRGPSGTEVRLQAIAIGGGAYDLLPDDGQGDEVSLTPAALPTCSVSPPLARPGQQVTLTAAGVPASQSAQVFVGDELAGTITSSAGGSLGSNVFVPATARPGVRAVEARFGNAGVSAACTVLVQGDALTPSTTATLNPEPNVSGWNRAAVTISLAAVDAPGGPGIQGITYSATGAQPIAPTTQSGAAAQLSISQEGQTLVSYFATNLAAVSEPPHTLTIKLDLTLPTITFSGNQGTYGILDTVAITCAASDALSGVLWDTCQTISGPAYQFAAGTNSYSATASDFAGNVRTASTSFQLNVTYQDLCTLTQQFIAASSRTPQQGQLLGDSLCAQLQSAQMANAKGKMKAERQALDAYVKQVKANTPTVFTAQQAQILIRLAGAL